MYAHDWAVLGMFVLMILLVLVMMAGLYIEDQRQQERNKFVDDLMRKTRPESIGEGER